MAILAWICFEVAAFCFITARMSLLKSSSKIGFYTFLSRAVGYVRESLVAKILGAGMLSDAFFVAFRLPNLFRSLFAEGAFNAAFIPMFAKLHEPEKAKEFAEQVFAVLFVFLLGLTILAQIFMPGFVWLLASGFAKDKQKFDITVYLTRITFPYLIFISLVSLQGGVLNSLHKFGAAAFAPVLMNLTMIFFMLGLAKYTETPAHALSWGVLASGVVQFVWLYYGCKKVGFALKLRWPKITPEIKTLMKRMLPVAIGAGVLQINVFINTQMASYIADGSVSYLYFADRLSQLPLAIIGTAIGTALLPMLSQLLRENKTVEANEMQNKGFGFAWFFSVPAALALAAIARPIVEVLFQRGQFTANDTVQVTNALIAYSLGIPAFVLIKIFTPGFYSHEDTKTPVQIAVFCIFINLLLSLVLLYGFGFNHVGLAISTSVSAWVNSALLWFILHKRRVFIFSRATLINAAKVLAAGVAMAFILNLTYNWLLPKTAVLYALALTIIIGGSVFLAVAAALGAVRIGEILAIIKRRNLGRKI